MAVDILRPEDIGNYLKSADPAQLAAELYDDPQEQHFFDDDSFKLEPYELDSPVWSKIQLHLTKKLLKHRLSNDDGLNSVDTAELRGKIKAVKEILALGMPLELKDDSSVPDPGY
tara:strand:+ start:5461 stop:5805 length:345 start_codon:yes stop_codon:yes gene_type:complete